MFYKFNVRPAFRPRVSSRQALARLIFQRLLTLQGRWAAFMQAQSLRLSAGRLKALSLAALVICAAYSSYLVWEGLMPLGPASVFSWPQPAERLNATKATPGKLLPLTGYLDSLEKAFLQDSLQLFNSKSK